MSVDANTTGRTQSGDSADDATDSNLLQFADDNPPEGSDSQGLYLNRELSWLCFNDRVLEEGMNPRHPLFERLRFVSISASNLDEFYMVRVAGLKGQVAAGVGGNVVGQTAEEQLVLIARHVARIKREQARVLRIVLEQLEKEGVQVLKPDALRSSEISSLKKTFQTDIFPALTPLAVDPAHPFPFIPNRGLVMIVEMIREKDENSMIGLIPLPANLNRFIRLPGSGIRSIALEDVVYLCSGMLFPNFTINTHGMFQVLRDSDVELDEEAEDLVRTFETMLRQRRLGQVIRLTINADMPQELRDFIASNLNVNEIDIYESERVIAFNDFAQIITSEKPNLLFPPFYPRFPGRIRDFGGNCFAAIRSKDIIVHHPYESFDVVVQFLRQAARDPNVITIKQTLYRTSKDSPIIAALIDAAESGKSVTALVELRARFDEAANILWARDLERVGVHVVYGFVDLKTHAKISLVVRRENNQLNTYVHYGTGNYHPITAKIYTDLSYFTCNPALGRDAARVFNYITGYGEPDQLEHVASSPINLRSRLLKHIEDERAFAKAGKPAQIWVKVNNLVDRGIIEAFYRASSDGVKISMIVRGICCLRPGVTGLSDNITVKSIIGRFLEHSRIYCFGNGSALPSKDSIVYISSADLMGRNLDRRVETMIPLLNSTVKRQVLNQIMEMNLQDEAQTWDMHPDGTYKRREPLGEGVNCHHFFLTNLSYSGRGKEGTETRIKPNKTRYLPKKPRAK